MVLFLFGQGIERQVAGIRKDPGLCLCEPRTAWRFLFSLHGLGIRSRKGVTLTPCPC